MTDKNDQDLVDRGLAAARDALAVSPPAGHADRVAAAALGAPRSPAPSWWTTALPIAWRAAVLVDAAAAVVVVALLLRAPPERPQPRGDGDAIDAMLDDETSAVLTRALRLASESEPVSGSGRDRFAPSAEPRR